MLKNQIKIAFRNISRQKFYTILNLVGLSIGLAACSLIILYIQDELSYDNFHEKEDRIYRINQTNIWGDFTDYLSATGPAVSRAVIEEIPEVEYITRVHTGGGNWLVSYKGNTIKPVAYEENRFFGVDSTFFEIFSFDMIEGNPHRALTQPNSIVLTQETALRYFGNEKALGKSLTVKSGNYQEVYQVTGVLADVPENSHIQFDMLGSIYSFPNVKKQEWSWIWTTFVNYVLLKEGTDLAAFQAKLKNLPKKYANPALKRLFGYNIDQFEEEKGKKWTMHAQPLANIHLHSRESNNRLGSLGDIQTVYMFGVVAFLVLLLSCINFMNLATARSAHRAKEVGVRKVLGSHRWELMQQFLVESSIFILIAAFLGILLCDLSLPYFNQLAQKNLSLWAMLNPNFLIALLLMIITMGVLSGAYPAFYLTSFQPTAVLKGKFTSGPKSKSFRNGLVVFQFMISIGLIICTILVNQQLKYVKAQKLGFDKEHLLLIPNVERLNTNYETFKNEISQLSAVTQASMSTSAPPRIWNQDYFSPAENPSLDIPLEMIIADESYLSTMGLELVAGRGISKKYATDIQAVVLNERAVREMGWKVEEAVGKSIDYYNQVEYKVVGVLKDFNFSSLQENISPCGVFLYADSTVIYKGDYQHLTVRLAAPVKSGKSLSDLLEQIEEKWDAFSPGIPFNYFFFDDRYQQAFAAEQQVSQVMSLFTLLAILIACLGLYGLASFTIEQRRKEIGIRKVLGAKMVDIMGLLSKEYIRLILIAFVLASPIAYYLMRQWLQDFPYRTTIQPSLFIMVGLGIVLLAWFTVGYQSFYAARQNPIDSLRDE